MKAKAHPLGIVIACLWALELAIEVIARTLSLPTRQIPSEEWRFTLTLPFSIIGGLYVLALGVAFVGVWQLREWGRKLLLALITLFYGALLISSVALWAPLIGIPLKVPGQGWVIIVVLEGVAGLGFGWWYLNRTTLRRWFDSDGPNL